MYLIVNPRSLRRKHPNHSVFDVERNVDTGERLQFDTLEEAKAYAREAELETLKPCYFIVEMVGW